MNVVIANTFTKALKRLDNAVQQLVKAAVFDFQMNPANPGFQLHRLDRAKDPNFWSFRVNQDVRGVVHQTDGALVICYVDHHDPAYEWAERRVLREHPETRAIQFVDAVEKVEEVAIPRHVHVEPPLFPSDKYEDEYLVALGLPAEYLRPIRTVTRDNLHELIEILPEEVMERFLALADGHVVPVPSAPRKAVGYRHPDSGRRFHIVDRQEELRQALDYPWEKWIVFLHPQQRQAVEAEHKGPALATGSAGTGKSVVAVHRAVELARRYPDDKILLTTFSRTLADDLEEKTRALLGDEAPERSRIDIINLDRLAFHQCLQRMGPFERVDGRTSRRLIEEELAATRTDALPGMTVVEGEDPTRSASFLEKEFEIVVDAWGVTIWEAYRDADRTGRGTALGVRQRRAVWSIFEKVLEKIPNASDPPGQGITWSQLHRRLASEIGSDEPLYQHAVVDEAQDFGPSELQLLRALVAEGPDDLFFAGDIGQRIYKAPFSWESVGIDVRGRSTKLALNYRTTQQIRKFADRLMPDEVGGLGEDGARASVALLAGDEPKVQAFESRDAETEGVTAILRALINDGVEPQSIAVVRRALNPSYLREAAEAAIEAAGLAHWPLAKSDRPPEPSVLIGTMHRVKGLEFDAMIVMGCDRDTIPYSRLLDENSDPADRETFMEQERNLLYVACTRARRFLYLTYFGDPSRFLTPSISTRPAR